MSVVSLLAAGTEIVCGLGAGEQLVGRSHECDNPDWVTRLPACTRPAFDVDVPSREIDAEVRRRVNAAEPLYYLDADLINSLEPDLLITQAHCDVCAVTPSDVQRNGRIVTRDVLALEASTLQDIYDGMIRVGDALHIPEAAAGLTASIQARINAVSAAVKCERRARVMVLEWIDPPFVMGNWGPDLVEAANGEVAVGEMGGFSREISWDEMQNADPDWLVVAPCGFSLARTIREASVLETLPGWFALRAVRERNVVLADGNKYFNRSGTTIADTVEILAEILHGLGTEHCGEAWWNKYAARGDSIEALHARACAGHRDSYIDPATGYDVFTVDFLRARGFCCSSGCQHCPYKTLVVGDRGLGVRS